MSPVHFGEDAARERKFLVKGGDDIDRVLAHHGVDREQDFRPASHFPQSPAAPINSSLTWRRPAVSMSARSQPFSAAYSKPLLDDFPYFDVGSERTLRCRAGSPRSGAVRSRPDGKMSAAIKSGFPSVFRKNSASLPYWVVFLPAP